MITKQDILRHNKWYELPNGNITNVLPNEYNFIEYQVSLKDNGVYDVVFPNKTYSALIPPKTSTFLDCVNSFRRKESVRVNKVAKLHKIR